jgi:hypothetical protein
MNGTKYMDGGQSHKTTICIDLLATFIGSDVIRWQSFVCAEMDYERGSATHRIFNKNGKSK